MIFKIDNEGNLIEDNTNYDFLNAVYNVQELTQIASEIKKAAQAYEDTAKKIPYLFNDVFYIGRITTR